jgi:hypothetical protein
LRIAVWTGDTRDTIPTADMTPSGLRNLNSCSRSVQYNQRECQFINWS